MDATKAKGRKPSIPRELRKEVVAHVRAIARRYRSAFAAEAGLKNRVLTLTCALLPPRRRRGRPRNEETTRAILLYSRFRRQHPEEKPHQIWSRVCGALFPEYADLSEIEQQDMRHDLRERVSSFRSPSIACTPDAH